MIRKRLLILLQGIIFVLLLASSTYILSNFYTYSLENFQASCIKQTQGASIVLREQLTSPLTWSQMQQKTDKLGHQLQLELELVEQEPAVDDEDIRQALQGNTGVRMVTDPIQGKVLLVTTPLKDGMVLRSINSLQGLTDGYERFRNSIIAALVVLMFLSFWLTQTLLTKQTAPLEQIAAAVTKWSQGDKNYRLPQRQDGEYGILSYAFNSMSDELLEKQAELQREKHKSQLILDNMDNGVAVLQEDGSLAETNRPFREVFGIDLKQVTNTTLLSFAEKCRMAKTAQAMTFTLPAGEDKKVFSVFGAPMITTFQAEPTNVLVVLHDITAIQAIYDKQAAFVSNASHELATPLTTIRGFAETLAEEDTGNDAVLRAKFLTIILEEVERMQSLIKDLLQLAKLDSREYRQSIVVEPLAVAGVLEKIRADVCKQAAARDLSLELCYDNEPGVIMANKDWLKQILLNLTENALKYTPAGGVITLSCKMLPDFAKFTVHNTGEGLSPTETKKIFDRFYRVDKARSRKAGGTGLGLSIVKFIVNVLGGEIKATSAPGEGVSFIFTLPAAKEQNDAKI